MLGLQVTQLGHVKDLADAFQLCLGNDKAYKQVFNISGERFVTFDGIAKACAEAAGAPAPELVHFNPKKVEIPKGKKAFPMRDQHFFASVDKVRRLWSQLGRACCASVPHLCRTCSMFLSTYPSNTRHLGGTDLVACIPSMSCLAALLFHEPPGLEWPATPDHADWGPQNNGG